MRELRTTIDEPVERGGTNQGLTPTETASLLACTKRDHEVWNVRAP